MFAAVVAPHHKLLGRMAKVCVAVHSLAAVFWGFVKVREKGRDLSVVRAIIRGTVTRQVFPFE